MKKILSLCIIVVLCLGAKPASAQTYTIGCSTCSPVVVPTLTNGGVVTTCSGFFYDNQPGTGAYLPNQNYTVTFIPGIAGRKMRLDFLEMAVSTGDSLEVFDGLSVAATRLAIFNTANNFTLAVTASVANTTNALTVRFRSDNRDSAAGWRAAVKCVYPCQPINGAISINGAATNSGGYIAVCRNTSLAFTANMTYPQSGQTNGYTQTNAINRFIWSFGSLGNDTSAIGASTVNRTMTQSSGYNVALTVIDTNGCSNTTSILAKIEGSVKPTVAATGGNICFGDTSTITASFQKNIGYFIKPPFQGKTNALQADNIGPSNQCNAAYYDTINISSFVSGTTLTNINDFIGVTINMEHSYMGDLDIQMIAPNGTIIQLKPFIYPSGLASSGNGTDLGEPIPFDGTYPTPGKGYSYRFTPQATRSMIEVAAPDGTAAPTHTYIGTDGATYTSTYLPAGDYAPRKEAPTPTPFTNMLGTALNGRWILRYCDNFTSDNGVIFFWNLDFAASLPSLSGTPEQYSIGIKDARFLPATGLISSTTTGNSTIGRVFPPVPLVYNYTYRVTDSANCVYDTVVKVFANPKPTKAALSGDTVICPGATATLRVATPATNTTYQWYANAQGTGTPLATGTTFTTPALSVNVVYYVKATNIALCFKIDTISVRILIPVSKPIITVVPALNMLTFNWQAVSGATGYQVSLDSGLTYITPSSGATGLSHTIAGLHPFETRSLIVRALGPVTCQNSDTAKAFGTTLLDELYIPNAFTPNGDGKNDIWKPYGWLIKELNLKIFNQWGQMIYATNNPNGGWDGQVSGKAQPVGVYVYVMRVVSQDGKLLDRKGAINLVR